MLPSHHEPRMTIARLISAVAFLAIAGLGRADVQESPHPDSPIPGKNWYIGLGLQGLISPSPGTALPIAASFEANSVVAMGEFTVGRDADGWGMDALGIQLGAVLSDHTHAPYALAGLQWMSIDRGFDPIIRGRSDILLTGEVGYVFWRAHVNGQLWLGLRGLLPLSTTQYASPPPHLPYANVLARLLF